MTSSKGCPRCSVPLFETSHDGVTLEVCPGCSGVLVPTRSLVKLLQQAAGELAHTIDLEAPIEPHHGPTAVAACPRCALPMTADGYMGTRIVTIDRCSTCSLVWIDPAELESMAKLWARTNRRTDAAYDKARLEQLEQAKRMGRMLLMRGVGENAGQFIRQYFKHGG